MSASGLTRNVAIKLDRPRCADKEFEHAFDACSVALYRYAVVRLGGDSHLADDMLQQVWLQARQSGTHVPADQLEYWLRGILANLVRTHWRKQRRRPKHIPLVQPELAAQLARRIDAEQLPHRLLEDREVREQLLLAITELSSEEQELIVQHYFHGRPHAELARELGVGVRAVEGRLYRARRALKRRLQHLTP